MAYRNGTYIAFHANGTNRPGQSDIDYYNMMKAWANKGDDDFTMVNSHEKAAAVRDSSSRTTLQNSLMDRLRNSKNMVLILGETTRFDTDWVPFEIEKAVDLYKLPIIVTYTEWAKPIRSPASFSGYWPKALADRINGGIASAIHIPYKKSALLAAIEQFHPKNLPRNGGLGYYSDEAYKSFGIDG